jgi:hypothetical protein
VVIAMALFTALAHVFASADAFQAEVGGVDARREAAAGQLDERCCLFWEHRLTDEKRSLWEQECVLDKKLPDCWRTNCMQIGEEGKNVCVFARRYLS